MAGTAQHFKVLLMVVTSPNTVLPFAGNDVIHFNFLHQLFAPFAFVANLHDSAFRFRFGLRPTVVVCVRTAAGA